MSRSVLSPANYHHHSYPAGAAYSGQGNEVAMLGMNQAGAGPGGHGGHGGHGGLYRPGAIQLPYRTAELPAQPHGHQQQHPPPQPHTHNHQLHQSFVHPHHHHHPPTTQHPHFHPPPQQRHPHQHAHAQPMSHPATYMPSEEELAQLQKLSAEYEPEATGPLVSERHPTSRITTEYANGDPVYKQKTAVLPRKYSEYRTCRGDGHCGWRAVAFAYFETIARLGDRNKLAEEVTRLSSLENILNTVGFSKPLYEDFAEETYDLLRRTEASLPVADNGSSLLETFNDQGISMAIITHIKLLTSAWIQTHADNFRPYLMGQDVKQYCASEIEPAVCEMDNIGLSALAEVLLKPAGIAVEVNYLDRSPGSEINTIEFTPDGMAVRDPPTIRLLYRPGHYDILYKPQDLIQPQPILPSQPAMPQSSVYVGLANSTDEYLPQSRTMASDIMAYIPGMNPFGFNNPSWSASPFDFGSSSPIPPQTMAPIPAYGSMPPAPAPQPPQAAPPPARHEYAPPRQEYPPPPQEFPSRQQEYQAPPVALDPPIGLPLGRPPALERGGPFRPSAYELDPFFRTGPPQNMPCQTSIFRNSPFNTAHYMNPDFQPEEWTPDQDYGSSHRSRNKSSS